MVEGRHLRAAARTGRRFEGLLGLATHTNVIPARVAGTHGAAGSECDVKDVAQTAITLICAIAPTPVTLVEQVL